MLDRLDPRALTRALLGPRSGGPVSASVRGYQARRRPKGENARSGPVKGRGRGWQDLPLRPGGPTAPGSISSAQVPERAGLALPVGVGGERGVDRREQVRPVQSHRLEFRPGAAEVGEHGGQVGERGIDDPSDAGERRA